jgi:stringent starvation protein B
MSEQQDEGRLRAVLSSLLRRRIDDSLTRLEQGLAAWRRGEFDALVAHTEVLHHVARIGTLSARVARAESDGPRALLRDAFDLELLERDEFQRLAGCQPEEVVPLAPLDDEAMPAPQPDKRQIVSTMLDGGAVLLRLDARRSGVDVPPGLRVDPRLVLRVGYRLTPPIPDLEVDEEGVRATLAFRGVPHACVIPWTAIYAIVGEEDGRGLVFNEDVPPEVVAEMRGEAGPTEAEPPPAPDPPKRRGGHLKLI